MQKILKYFPSLFPMLFPVIFSAAVLLLNGCADGRQDNRQDNSPDSSARPEPHQENNTDAADRSGIDISRITGVSFIYDRYSGDALYLRADAMEMSGEGANVQIEKRIGPLNHTGVSREGAIRIGGEEVQALRDILGRYDLKAWSEIRETTTTAWPSRSLYVFDGDELVYEIDWNTKFPETLPPQEDIMYAELFNFFNGLIRAEPGWEDVRSDDLEDPRDNPAYAERTVTWFGNEVRLVPGTGEWSKDGAHAEIDYEGRDWWIEEGFTGSWTLDEEHPTDGLNTPASASLQVNEDGTVLFILDGEEWTGSAASVRRYRDSAGVLLERNGNDRFCTVDLMQEESYERIHLTCYPGPVPEEQFTPIDVYLVKEQACASAQIR